MARASKKLKIFSLLLLVFQTTTLVLTMRYSQTRTEKPKYLVTTAVVMAEIVKLVANSSILLFKTHKCNFKKLLNDFYIAFITDYSESCKVIVTAIIYTLQNNLLYLAAANLDAATYQVSYQTKILTTAFFAAVIPPRQKISCRRWIALVLLTFGVTLVQMNNLKPEQKDISGQNRLVGLAAILTSAVTSGFGGIYFERLMKNGKHSMWMRNCESAFFSIIFGFVDKFFFIQS